MNISPFFCHPGGRFWVAAGQPFHINSGAAIADLKQESRL